MAQDVVHFFSLWPFENIARLVLSSMVVTHSKPIQPTPIQPIPIQRKPMQSKAAYSTYPTQPTQFTNPFHCAVSRGAVPRGAMQSVLQVSSIGKSFPFVVAGVCTGRAGRGRGGGLARELSIFGMTKV